MKQGQVKVVQRQKRKLGAKPKGEANKETGEETASLASLRSPRSAPAFSVEFITVFVAEFIFVSKGEAPRLHRGKGRKNGIENIEQEGRMKKRNKERKDK